MLTDLGVALVMAVLHQRALPRRNLLLVYRRLVEEEDSFAGEEGVEEATGLWNEGEDACRMTTVVIVTRAVALRKGAGPVSVRNGSEEIGIRKPMDGATLATKEIEESASSSVPRSKQREQPRNLLRKSRTSHLLP